MSPRQSIRSQHSSLAIGVVLAVALCACGGVTGSSFRDLAVACDGGPGSCGGGGCTSELQCNVANPRCDKNSGQCVPCLPQNDNCPIGSHCVAQNGSFACAAACRTSADCSKGDGGASRECCNAACLDTMGDRANCGGCGKACAPLPNTAGACVGGVCALGSCNPGFADCNQSMGDGCETATAMDGKNCGACGNVCPPVKNGTGSCAAGRCAVTCSPGFLHCSMIPDDGCEVNGTSDPQNCGGCGKACPVPANSVASCVNGACGVGMCKFGFGDCDKDPMNGCEADLLSPRSCGACGNSCPAPAHATAACQAGVCGVGMCDALYGDCNNNAGDGCERSLSNDINSCGVCGHVCTAANGTPGCLNGVCGVLACNPGFADCNKNAADGCEVNTANDAKNCGACGSVCGAQKPNCANGACVSGCVGTVGGAIVGVMPMPLYGFCWYVGLPGFNCDSVCTQAGGGTNQANAAINAFADDCSGGGVGQPATWFFQTTNPGQWVQAAGVSTVYRSLGHGLINGAYYGKCSTAVNAGSGTFPGVANNDFNRTVVCACSK